MDDKLIKKRIRYYSIAPLIERVFENHLIAEIILSVQQSTHIYKSVWIEHIEEITIENIESQQVKIFVMNLYKTCI